MSVIEILKKVWALLTTIFMGLTMALQGFGPAQIPEAELVNEYQYVLDEAFVAAQGLALDGDTLYTGGAISAVYLGGLGKIDLTTGKYISSKLGTIPFEFIKKEYDHIGGIGYYDGKIYAAVEDLPELYPLVLIYDAETLEYTGTYYDMTNEVLDDGIPWVTVDPDNGYLYCSSYHDATELVAYNLDDMSFSHYIPLSESVDRVQAGSYLDGKVYLNLDTKGTTKTVVSVDINSGEVTKVMDRKTSGIDTESEGIAAFYTDDGKLGFYICDYDKTVAIFIREYIVK